MDGTQGQRRRRIFAKFTGDRSRRARNVGFVRVVLQHGRRAARGRGRGGRRRVRALRPGRASVPQAGGAQG